MNPHPCPDHRVPIAEDLDPDPMPEPIFLREADTSSVDIAGLFYAEPCCAKLGRACSMSPWGYTRRARSSA